MKVTIDQKIAVDSIDSLDNETVINNESISSDSFTDITDGFKVVSTQCTPLIITDPLYTLDMTTMLTDACFVSIQCNKYVASPTQKPTPIRFGLDLDGGAVTFNASTFSLVNTETMPAIIIDGVPDASTSNKVVLTIVIGKHS